MRFNRLVRSIFSFGLVLGVSSSVALASVSISGTSYYSVPEIAKVFGMKWKWVVPQEEAILKRDNTILRFHHKKRYATINNHQVWLGGSPKSQGGLIYVSEKDVKQTLRPLLNPNGLAPVPKLYHIVIDPGHGGKDEGAVNKEINLKEKDVVLDLAHRLKSILSSQGYRVTLTRSSDRFIPLEKRTEIANKNNADLFLSLHFNSVGSGRAKVKGIETFAFTPFNQPSTSRDTLHETDRKTYPANQNDAWNTLVAFCVQSSLSSDLQSKDRGMKRSRFTVLKNLECPGALIEGGFISHPEEGRQIADAAYRDRVARSIVKGILRYQNIINQLRTS